MLVGGAVRDHLLGLPTKDFDVEVFGLDVPQLEAVLRQFGRVNPVGKAFAVFKLNTSNDEVDVSLPRRDSKVGPGHKGIQVIADPFMAADEAARRRDLTINAISYDPIRREYVDPADGMLDLERGVLRAVDPTTFLEDPLRALRVVQFAARLGFPADDELLRLCRDANLHELPPERVQMEWQKLFFRAEKPSVGFDVARACGILQRVFPGVVDDPHVNDRVDRAAARRSELTSPGRVWALMLTAWLWNTPSDALTATLDRLWLHKVGGYSVRDAVLNAVGQSNADISSDAALRWASTRAELAISLRAQAAAGNTAAGPALARAQALGIEHAAPPQWVQGRDLIALGLRPSPRFGELLKAAYACQLDGDFASPADALQWTAERAQQP